MFHRATTPLLLAALLALAAGFPLAAQRRNGWTLEAVLKQLDTEAKQFQALTASLERTKFTAVVNDRSTEAGQIFVRRDDKMRIEITQPDPRTVLRRGDDFYVFNPRTNRVEQFDLGKNRSLVEQFLLLGFGTPGGDLRKGYLLTLLGEPQMGGRRVVWLELTPKSEEVRHHVSKIQLWIDQANWLPVQQKFFETGSGDYMEIRYSNVVRNPRIPDSRFRAQWPRGATILKR